MVTILNRRQHGVDLRMYPGDHDPPYLHVWKGDKHIKIYLNTFEVERNRGYNTREIRSIWRLVNEHQQLLLEVWHAIHEQGERPG